MSVASTANPRPASRRAISRPKPRPAPVTTAIEGSGTATPAADRGRQTTRSPETRGAGGPCAPRAAGACTGAVDLDRVPLRGHVAALELAPVLGYLGQHPLSGGQRNAAFEDVRDPLRLQLGYRHDRVQRLDQADEVQVLQVRVHHAPVEVDPVVTRRIEQLRIEEREADLVARAVDDLPDPLHRAVGEPHAVALEALDVGLDLYPPVADAPEQIGGDRGVGLTELVVGLGQAEVGRVAVGGLDLAHEQRAQDRKGERPDHPVRRQLVAGGRAEVLGDDPRPAAHSDEGLLGNPRGLDGDVAGGVADAQHQHPLALIAGRGLVIVRVDRHPAELPREGGSGQRGSQWWPLATITASKFATDPSSRVTSQPPPAPRATSVTSVRKRMCSRNPKWST